MSKLQQTRNNKIRKYVAVHEAGHAVAGHLTQLWLGRPYNQFHQIVVRTAAEIERGPLIDSRRRALDVLGWVESPDRYSSLGLHVEDLRINATSEECHALRNQWRKNMEADVIGLLSGPVAELRQHGYSRLGVAIAVRCGKVSFEDFAIARSKIKEFARTDAETENIFCALLARSMRLIGRNWPAVDALANGLLKQPKMNADEAVSIMNQFMLRKW
jgi:hypothetical protein